MCGSLSRGWWWRHWLRHSLTCEQADVRALETTVKQHNEELAALKRELRAGFMTVCDSIEEVKLAVEARRQLMEQQLRKEMRSTYAKIVTLDWRCNDVHLDFYLKVKFNGLNLRLLAPTFKQN